MVQLAAKKRDVLGKKVKALRNEGILPAVIYGAGHESQNISVNTGDFGKVWKSAGESTLIDLDIEGGDKKSVIIHDIAVDPRKGDPIHVDFLEVRADQKITASVPLEFDGESDAVKTLGGVLMKLLHEVEIEALPKDLIHEIKVDISTLKTFEDVITLKDLKLPGSVEFLLEDDVVVAKVEEPREEEPAEEVADVDLSTIEVEKKGKKEETKEGEEESVE